MLQLNITFPIVMENKNLHFGVLLSMKENRHSEEVRNTQCSCAFYIPLKLRFILALSNSPKIRSAMFTEDGNIGGNGNMFLGNFRGLQT